MATKKIEYDDQSISSLKGADRVRKRPGVIFGSDGLDGCEHSVFEIISNSIDEAREGYGKKIIITRYADHSVQIEDFVRAHPAVKDVAVIGTPDKRLGEVTTAVIEVKEGAVLTADEVNQFCEELPRYKRPKQIIFADVPRNPTGKIEKPKLREKYCGK